jgi:hypothetical protein
MIATATASHSHNRLFTAGSSSSSAAHIERSAGGRLASGYETGYNYSNDNDEDDDDRDTDNSSNELYSTDSATQRQMIMTKAERERSRMFVRALYEYSTDDPTSLSFRAGDVIQVLKQLDSGWWDGIVNGQRGWFPSNYCILVPPGEQNGGLLSDDSEDGDEDDSYDEYDDGSASSDSERELASPGLPMEGTNIGKNDVAGLWVPQATPHGRLFYFNLETAETRQELPLEAPTSTTETGPRDRSKSIPDQTRPPPEILARGYEREEPPYRSKSEDDDSASDKDGELIVLNGANTAVVSAFDQIILPLR